jgi:glutathione S-transferase
MADCSAAPALFFAKRIVPFAGVDNLSKYFDRLMARPSVARVYREAEPYMKMFPIK